MPDRPDYSNLILFGLGAGVLSRVERKMVNGWGWENSKSALSKKRKADYETPKRNQSAIPSNPYAGVFGSSSNLRGTCVAAEGSSKAIDLVKNGAAAGVISTRMLRPVTIPTTIKMKPIGSNFNEFVKLFDRSIKLSQQFGLMQKSQLGKRAYMFMNFRHNYFTHNTVENGASETVSNALDVNFPRGGVDATAIDSASKFMTPEATVQQYTNGVVGIKSALRAVVDGQTWLAGLNKCFLAETSYRLAPEIVKLKWDNGPDNFDDVPQVTSAPVIGTNRFASYHEKPINRWIGGQTERLDYSGGSNLRGQLEANENEPYRIRNTGGTINLNFNNQGDIPVVIDIVVFKTKEGYIPPTHFGRPGNPDSNPAVPPLQFQGKDDISKKIFESYKTAQKNWNDQNKLSKSNKYNFAATGNEAVLQPDERMDDMEGYEFSDTACFDDPRMKFLAKFKGFEQRAMPSANAEHVDYQYYNYNQGSRDFVEVGRYHLTLGMGDRRRCRIHLRPYSINCAENAVPTTYTDHTNRILLMEDKFVNGLWPNETVCLAIGQRGIEAPVVPNDNTHSYIPCGMQAGPSNVIITGEYVENVKALIREETIVAPYYKQNLGRADGSATTELVTQTQIPMSAITRTPGDASTVQHTPAQTLA